MNKVIKKTISSFLIFGFLLNVVLPVREALAMTAPWWSGSQGTDNTGVPSAPPTEGNRNDNRDNQQPEGEPVFIHNGDFIYEHQDFLIPSRAINTEIIRTYKSQSRYNNRFGYGWDIFYNKKIVPLCNGDLFYLNGQLNRDRFIYIDGTNYISPAGIYDKIVQNPDGTFTLTENHGTVYEFDQNGVLTQVQDRNNNSLQFDYDPNGRLPIIGKSVYSNDPDPKIIAYDYKLVQITDPVGRNINLNYDATGHLIGITDFASRSYTYAYDSSGNGDLISFTAPATTEYPSGLTTTYGYDNQHNLTTITDAKGQTYLTNRYDAEDRVYEQDYGSGTFHFSYYTASHKTTVTDPKGFVTEWIYNDNGAPVSKKEFTADLRITDPDYYTTAYTHNSDLERTSVTNPKGNGIKYTFDEGNPNPQAQGNLLEIRRKSQMSQPDDPVNDIVTSFTYEPNFNLIQTITDPKGNVTTFNYDTNGNLAAIIYPEVSGQIPQTSFAYNSYGQVETVTDPNNNLVRYEYFTDTGYLKKIIQDPNGINAITQFAYDSVGNVTLVTDAKGSTSAFEYNALTQLTKQIAAAPFNYQTKYSYDQNGNLTKMERQANPQASLWQTTQYAYTILDQLQTITDPLNHSTNFSYDLNGNRSSVTDANNKATAYQYDERNLIWKVTDANAPSGITEYAYDLNGNLAVIKDARANQTQYAYDGFDRLQTTTYADSSYAQYTYDKNSNLAQLQKPNLDLITYAYDSLNRLDLKTYPDASNVDYTYDLGSRLTSIEDQASRIDYVYDSLNRITSTTNTLNSTAYTLDYGYDSLGNRTQVVYPSGYTLDYTYDQLNRLTAIKHLASGIVNYSYDTLSRRVGKKLAGGNLSTNYRYDTVNRLLSITNRYIPSPVNPPDPHQQISQSPSPGSPDNRITFNQISNYNPNPQNQPNDRLSGNGFRQGLRNPYRLWATLFGKKDVTLTDNRNGYRSRNPNPSLWSLVYSLWSINNAEAAPPGSELISNFTYTYDNIGNRLTQQTQRAQQTQETYGYDAVYQVIGVSGNQEHSYDYDQVGNREVVDSVNYVSNNLNQYTDVGGSLYQYDQNGNLTSDGTNTYTYDYENRLITASGGGQNSSYQYDAFGRRISKTVDGLTTYFVYDGDQVIEEHDASGSLTASYIYGTGIDEVLTMNRNAQTYYYFYDGLSSVTDITNVNGEVVESYSYDVYGLPNQTSQIGNRFYFTGREFDEETGIYHYRARTYSPSIGRFLQRDSITWAPDDSRLNKQINLQTSSLLLAAFWQNLGIKDVRQFTHDQQLKNILGAPALNSQLLHLYSYCLNSPTNFIDPQGKWIWLLSGLVGAGIAVFIEAGNENYTLGSLVAAGVIGGVSGVLAPFFAGSVSAAMGWGMGAGLVKNLATTWARGENICISKAFTSAAIGGLGAGWGYGIGSLADSSVLGMLLGGNVRLWWGW